MSLLNYLEVQVVLLLFIAVDNELLDVLLDRRNLLLELLDTSS